MVDMMGQAGMAEAAVRYLRSAGTAPLARPVEALPRPDLRCVRENERAPVDQGEFRRVLGNFATGVTVVTAPATALEAGPDGPVGFACQSFTSLSLDPPLVAFMVGRTSTTWPRIARTGVFCVNVLSTSQSDLCRAFAVSGADKFAGVAYDAAPVTGSPRLADTLAWIDCAIHAVHTGGDHLVVVGRVEALGTSDDADRSGPLVFYRGQFGRFDSDSGDGRDPGRGNRTDRSGNGRDNRTSRASGNRQPPQ
jgi:3-hydroxy-9,10-secoandrosta-1,3,5(10)-triene-9,17-dione monooxygenase reductase component